MKRLCDDPTYNHLKQSVEKDQQILAKQHPVVNKKVKERYDNNTRKLHLYEVSFINKEQ